MEKETHSFAQAEFEVIHWMDKVGIAKHGTFAGQLKKLREEVQELDDAYAEKDDDKFVDAVGDIMIVLTAICLLEDLDLRQCYHKAAEIVTKRTGKMREDGIFYKDQ